MSDESLQELKQDVAVVLDAQSIESSEDPPMSEWPSLIISVSEKKKKVLDYEHGLYDPGSGEICTKYISQSDSDIEINQYKKYPPVTDPGIDEALFDPDPSIKYDENGQDLYIALCKEMNHAPVRLFHAGLLENEINLNYYCVHPPNVRAMAQALYYNRTVKVISLIDNFLSVDACYHLGEMLKVNATLQELNLSGCKIGAEGGKRIFHALRKNKTLKALNLNRNQLNEEGGLYFAEQADEGLALQQIYLSYNNLGNKFATAISESLDVYNTFTHIDLSWNNLFSPLGTCKLLNILEENKELQYLNLAWNGLEGPRIAAAIKNTMKAPNLLYLVLNNNKFSGEDIPLLIGNLGKAKKLVTFDLSGNPLSPQDAVLVLNKMRFRTVKVQNLRLDNIAVNQQFLDLLEKVKKLKYRQNTFITYGEPVGIRKSQAPDPRDIVLNRAEYLCQKSKNKVDIALVFLQLVKDNNRIMEVRQLTAALQTAGAPLGADLIEAFAEAFPGPKKQKSKSCNLLKVQDFIFCKWPDRKLPPTPPPEEEVVIPGPVPGKSKGVAKKGKK